MNAPTTPERAADTRVRLADYRPPAWHIDHTELEFDLDSAETLVHARLKLRRDPAQDLPLQLDGEGLELLEIRLDGVPLAATDYCVDAHGLSVPQARDGAVLETRVRIRPVDNTSLSGLYTSGVADRHVLLSQCEAQGFRRITYFADRPDVLSHFRVTLRAQRDAFPLLLSNGNPAGAGELADGRHWACWEDPHPKPCYLFALVAGALATIEDRHVTDEGRVVSLRIHADRAVIDRCGYAMDALKRSMRWDEVHYGRNYDLDVFQIVATDDFNMGAMENKGLNIFNAKYLLADPQRSTDEDYRHVEAIVAHEYFHNWTGNRVTCRDWFQLSLKEGLTVFREQQFCADAGSVALKRIEDVQVLRRAQFPEDAGPLAHAVRPDHYAAIDNFYTATVYDKGAELIRMLATRLGAAGWRAGMDEYFRRHDGQAATLEQFLAALGEANDLPLQAYLAWYAQAGTPSVQARGAYDAVSRTYTLSLAQHTAATPGQPHKLPLPIPVRVALLGDDGAALPLRLEGAAGPAGTECMLDLVHTEQSWRFVDLPRPRARSLLRSFSAPVRLLGGADVDELAFLLRHEDDGFNRWEASQQLAQLAFDEQLLAAASAPAAFAAKAIILDVSGAASSATVTWSTALASLLEGTDIEPALLAELLTPPDELELIERCVPCDPVAVHAARIALDAALARRTGAAPLHRHTQLLAQERGSIDGTAQNRRRLLSRCLSLAAYATPNEALAVAARRCVQAPSMSERLAALSVLALHDAPQAEPALAEFERANAHDPVTLDKWFALQAQIPRPDTLQRVERLLLHPAFSLRNPNRVYALLRTFALRNPVAFHREDGAGYALIERLLPELDALNPQVAARIATTLKDFRRLEPGRNSLMQASLQRLSEMPGLSTDLTDILRRALG